jgi:hypothetical protein
MEPLKPIRAKSITSFGLIWLLTVLVATVTFPIATVLWTNFYDAQEPDWIGLLYRQKQVVLDRRADAPRRLIIIGGSGALFSLDAEVIENKLNIPTINFATHAGLGLRYPLEKALREVRRGDIVLVVPEYGAWYDSYCDSPGPGFEYIFTYDKSYLARMDWIEAGEMICAVPWSSWPRSAKGWLERFRGDYSHFSAGHDYCVASLSPNGDLRAIPPIVSGRPKSFIFPSGPSLESVRAVLRFASLARSKGVRLLWSWPSFVRPSAVTSPPPFLVDLLRGAGFDVLNDPEQQTFPLDWFMDSPYHANPCCRRVGTEELIRRLRPALGLPAAPEKISGVFLVAGIEHRPTAGNLFAQDPGMVFRYLGTDSDARAISPEEVVRLVRAGTPVFTDAEASRSLLASSGLGLKLESHQMLSISQWFGRYPSSLFCLSVPPGQKIDPQFKSALPPAVYQRLAGGEGMVAIFGSGRYAGVNLISPVTMQQPLEKLLHGVAFPCIVSLGTDSGISVDFRQFVSSSRGVCAIAIDPEMGTVVDKAIFHEGSEIEIWRLYRVVADPETWRHAL